MDETTRRVTPVVHSTRFRHPSPVERRLGLWVDRIGSGPGHGPMGTLRLLGLYAIVAVESGRGFRMSEDGRRIPVETGDVLLVFPDEPASYAPVLAWHTRWIVWGGPEAERLERLGFLSRVRPVVRGAVAEAVRTYFALAGRMDAEDPVSALERKTAVLELVARLCSAGHGRAQASAAERLVAPILDHPECEARIEEWAMRHRMSATHFRRLFKRHTGRSPRAYITELRVARAKALLAAGLSIKETASRVGYADPLYFMRVFRRHAGQTAGRFAQANRIAAESVSSAASGTESVP